MSRVRVVVINGAPGVGKTTIARRLARRLPGPTACIDADDLAQVHPWRLDDALLDLMAANLNDVLPRMVAWGARTIVVSGVFLDDGLLPRIDRMLRDWTLEWHWYALRARAETLVARVDGDTGVHGAGLRRSMTGLDAAIGSLEGMSQVVTDDLGVDAIVEEILSREAAEPTGAIVSEPSTELVPTRMLADLAVTCLVRRGVDREDARAWVAGLVAADRDGVGSHGLIRIPEYAAAFDSGELDANRRPERTRAATAWLLHGNGAAGWYSAQAVRDLLARATPEAPQVVRVIRGGHLGRLGDIVRPLAASGLVVAGWVTFSGTGQKVAAAGATAGTIATNPLVLGFPAHGDPVVVDTSTSNWTEGAVRVAAAAREALPAGVLGDGTGRWLRDPSALYRADAAESVSLGPLGAGAPGTEGKGYALGILVELLGGALGGGLVCADPQFDGKGGNSGLFVAVHPETLGHRQAEVRDLVDQLDRHVRTRPSSAAGRTPRLPGRGARAAESGELLVPVGLVAQLRSLAEGP